MSSLDRILPFLKPIEDLLVDSSVTEVMVNDGGRRVFIEREGAIEAVAGRTLEPRNLTCRINLGDLYLRQGKTKEAKAEYREGLMVVERDLSLAPDDKKLGVQRTVFLAKAGDCSGARKALEPLLPSLPADDAEIAYAVAMTRAICGQHAEAVEALGRAIRLGSSPEYIREEAEFRSLLADTSIARLLRERQRRR